MRCCCCNRNLSDYESALKSATTGDYLDMCKKCLKDLDIPTLKNTHDPDEQSPQDESYFDMEEMNWSEPIIFDDDV